MQAPRLGATPAPAPAPTEAPFWRALVSPDAERAAQLVLQGRAQLAAALTTSLLGEELPVQRRVALDNALARFERALALAPDLHEARLLRARALARREGDPEASRAHEEAVAELMRLEACAPLFAVDEVARELGLLHARAGRFEEAAAAYERAVAYALDDTSRALLLGNLAEVTMLRGDLTYAIRLYERALHEGAEGSDRLLALWGLAVALDRLGEPREALQQAERALREDRAPMLVLHQAGVSFSPAHELAYYEGLGHLALLARERAPGEPLAEALARAEAWLLAPRHEGALRALAPLLEWPQRELPYVRALRARLAHARSRPSVPGTRAEDAPPEPPAARLMRAALSALDAFSHFAAHAGEGAPFVDMARSHVQALNAALGAPARR